MKKIFSTKVFFILVIISALSIIVVGKYIEKSRYNALEERKEATKDNPLMAYIGDKEYDLNDVMKSYKWKKEATISIAFGVNHTGEGISRYYIDDKEIVQEILTQIYEMNFYEITGNIPDDYTTSDEKLWDCKLFNEVSDINYAVYMDSEKLSEEGMVLLDDKMNTFLGVFEKYIPKLTVEKIIEWNSEGNMALEEYFRYEHLPLKQLSLWMKMMI